MSDGRMDGRTDGRTDEWMDRARREAKGRKVERISPRGVEYMKGMHDYMGGFKRVLLALNPIHYKLRGSRLNSLFVSIFHFSSSLTLTRTQMK